MLPHHLTSFAMLALADNCKLWSGNKEMEQRKKKRHCLWQISVTLARINVLLQKSCCLLQAKPRSSDEGGWRDHAWLLFLLPSLYLHSVSHTHCIHPPCPGESPCQCPILPETLSYPLLSQRRAKPDGTMRLESVADRSMVWACSNVAIPTDPLSFPFLWSAHNWRQICKQGQKQETHQPGFPQSPHSQGQLWDAGFYLGAVTSAYKFPTQYSNGDNRGLAAGQPKDSKLRRTRILL